MGQLSQPGIAEFVLRLRDKYQIRHLVETGTFLGESTLWASDNFEFVTTIDIREDYQDQARQRCAGRDNIHFVVGDTRKQLPTMLDILQRLGNPPAFFWLDAHNASHLFGDGPDDCPVLDEMYDILMQAEKYQTPHCILIDDAHCFVPPVPHDAKVWPEVWQIKASARRASYSIGVAHDAIACLPQSAQAELEAFAGSIAPPEPDNRLSAVVGLTPLPQARRRFSCNLFKPRPFKVRATMAQGGSPPAWRPHTNPDITEVLDTQLGRLLVPRHDTNQTAVLRGGFAMSHQEIDMLIELIKQRPPGAVFVDVGANVGTFGFALQQYCNKVYMFEPQRVIFNMLCGSVALNGWDNVYCYHAAVSDKSDLVEIPQFDYGAPCSFGSIEFGDTQIEPLTQFRARDPDKVEYVPTMSIDMFAFSRLDAIKIDVEGMELQVLAGATNTIATHQPIIMIEHGKVGMAPLRDQLKRMGYNNISNTGGDFLAIPDQEKSNG